MEVQEALSQIAEIHRHLARTEHYRGYRSITMAFTGVVAVGGGLVQNWFVPLGAGLEFVRFWCLLALVNILVVSGEIVLDSGLHQSRREQRLAWRSVAQFLPSLTAGGVCTVALAFNPHTVGLLPGIWCVLFSLGVFASRPYLPHGVGWVGLFYLVCGSVLLFLAPLGLGMEPWGMAGAFGTGQMLLALVLYWNLERPSQ